MKGKPTISQGFRELIEETFGQKIEYTYQCIPLEASIYEKTGEHLGLTTLKRLLGFVDYNSLPRKSTLDILSRYAGFQDYDSLKKIHDIETATSAFTTIERVDSEDLDEGQKLTIRSRPDRVINLEYTGRDKYHVLNSQGSKLKTGDILTIRQIAKGFELIVTDVERDGESLGSYIAAQNGGITSIRKERRE